MGRGDQIGSEGARECAGGMREEWEEEVPGRQQMDARGETLRIAHVNAGWQSPRSA